MALEDDIRKLSRIALFHAMETDALRLIAFGAETKILRSGDILFRRGDASDGGFIVLSGSVALDENNDGSPPAHIVQPDSLIGQMALIVSNERSVTAIAREPSMVLKISRDLFHRVLREYPKSAQRLRAALAGQLTSFMGELNQSRLSRDGDV
ncbi:MAG: Crp/Fnr family transcriptional regulator [Beijerinckiaceae bacterium]